MLTRSAWAKGVVTVHCGPGMVYCGVQCGVDSTEPQQQRYCILRHWLKYLVCRGVGPEHVLAVDVVTVRRLQGK